MRASITQLQKLELPRKCRRERNKLLVHSLANTQAESFIKLKEIRNKKTVQRILDDFNNDSSSCMSKVKNVIEDMNDGIKKFCHKTKTQGLVSSLNILGKSGMSYSDFVRDMILVVLILQTTDYRELFNEDSSLFQNVVVWLLIATIVVPIFFSAIQTSIKHPLIIFRFHTWHNFTAEQPSWWKMFFIKIVVFVCYLFVPAVLIINKEKAKGRRQDLEAEAKKEFDSNDGIVSNKVLDEQEQIESYLDEVRKAQLIFKRNESTFEIVVQQGIQLTMLGLSLTKYPLVSGLQGIFGKDSDIDTSKTNNAVELALAEAQGQLSAYIDDNLGLKLGDILLVLSVCWSFKTGIMSFLKIHSEQKSGMLSAAGKATLGFRALLFYTTRIVCVIAFFGPFLGLANCQAHFLAEKIELAKDLLKNVQGSNSYWDRNTVDLMYRSQKDNDHPTDYTMVTLKTASYVFIGVLLLHGIAIFILKIVVSKHFKKTSWSNKIAHVAESLHVPDAYKDFDVGLKNEERTPEGYKRAHKSVQQETFWMTLLQMCSNLLLLVPLLVTGGKILGNSYSLAINSSPASKVSEKHTVLVLNIETYPEEDTAFKLLNNLSIALPLLVVITWVIDALLATAYLKWFHPWQIILQEVTRLWRYSL